MLTLINCSLVLVFFSDDECDIMMYFKDDHIMPYYYGDLNPPQNRRHFDVTEHPSLFEDTDFIDNSKTCIG